MTKRFIIKDFIQKTDDGKDLYFTGHWSEIKSFSPLFLSAIMYDTEEEAKSAVSVLTIEQDGIYQIETIYMRN